MSQWNPDDDDLVDELPAPPRKSIPEADRELLELAARAIGAAQFDEIEGEGCAILHFADGSKAHGWNPLQFGDDAFNLAVDLRIKPSWPFQEEAHADDAYGIVHVEQLVEGGDVKAATRLAIVRAAAEIGKQRS